jgi:hypothetical protein
MSVKLDVVAAMGKKPSCVLTIVIGWRNGIVRQRFAGESWLST